uniref:Uncharacterized protein n=1 Tax=Arundo donax TaxID=35708 RepID=A0A0A9FVT8_ARUDO
MKDFLFSSCSKMSIHKYALLLSSYFSNFLLQSFSLVNLLQMVSASRPSSVLSSTEAPLSTSERMMSGSRLMHAIWSGVYPLLFFRFTLAEFSFSNSANTLGSQ